MSKLTEKQKAFCDFYIESLNAKESAIKAGYSPNSAKVIGCENLTKPYLKEYIDKRLDLIKKHSIMNIDEIMIRLSEKARGDSYEEVVTVTQLGAVVKDKKQISEKDQLKALELLGKRYRLFTDKIEATISEPVTIVDDIGDDIG